MPQYYIKNKLLKRGVISEASLNAHLDRSLCLFLMEWRR